MPFEIPIVPTVAFPPTIPATLQRTFVFGDPVTMEEKLSVVPVTTFATVGITDTETTSWTVTTAEPEAVGSAKLVAVTVTFGGEGAASGAVYTPSAEIVPTVLFPPEIPFTAQVTDAFDVPTTPAVNVVMAPGATVARDGVTVTVT
jgi:hypothetical protein